MRDLHRLHSIAAAKCHRDHRHDNRTELGKHPSSLANLAVREDPEGLDEVSRSESESSRQSVPSFSWRARLFISRCIQRFGRSWTPEYVAFHERYMQYVVPDHLKAWDGSARTHPSLPPGGSVPIPVRRIQDVRLENCQLRVFVPDDLMGDQKAPALLWFHGGGWAIGSIDSENDFCAYICQTAKCVVVTVGYRLAPEHPYPAAAEDAIEAFQWLFKQATKPTSFNIDPQRVAVGGTSAGGNLAAVLLLEAACLFRTFKPVFQLLVVPVIDNKATPGSGSGWTNIYAPWLTPDRMLWYRKMYLPNDGIVRELSREDWQISPNMAPSKLLSKCPPTWIAVAEHDLLATEALSYASQLRAAKVQADVKVYPGSTHSILALNGVLARGRELMWDAASVLSRAFRPQYFAPWPSPEGSV